MSKQEYFFDGYKITMTAGVDWVTYVAQAGNDYFSVSAQAPRWWEKLFGLTFKGLSDAAFRRAQKWGEQAVREGSPHID